VPSLRSKIDLIFFLADPGIIDLHGRENIAMLVCNMPVQTALSTVLSACFSLWVQFSGVGSGLSELVSKHNWREVAANFMDGCF
jgi:hypothetical protein